MVECMSQAYHRGAELTAHSSIPPLRLRCNEKLIPDGSKAGNFLISIYRSCVLYCQSHQLCVAVKMKIKLNIQLLSCTSYVSSSQQPHVASSSCDRKCRYRTFASFQKILLNTAVLTKDPQAYSEKSQIANILGFEGRMVSGATTQICCCSVKAATGNM